VKNKALKQGLVGLVGGTAIALGALGLGGCGNYDSSFCQRVDNATTLSYENKQKIKDDYKTFDAKAAAKKLEINYDDIKKADREERRKLAEEFNKEIANADIFDPNNFSDKEIVFMQELIKKDVFHKYDVIRNRIKFELWNHTYRQ
jgi:hypothetical protein